MNKYWDVCGHVGASKLCSWSEMNFAGLVITLIDNFSKLNLKLPIADYVLLGFLSHSGKLLQMVLPKEMVLLVCILSSIQTHSTHYDDDVLNCP